MLGFMAVALVTSATAQETNKRKPEPSLTSARENMVRFGVANSRMKDYCDIWALSREFDFDGAQLSDAIRATFRRRASSPSLAPAPTSWRIGMRLAYKQPLCRRATPRWRCASWPWSAQRRASVFRPAETRRCLRDGWFQSGRPHVALARSLRSRSESGQVDACATRFGRLVQR